MTQASSPPLMQAYVTSSQEGPGGSAGMDISTSISTTRSTLKVHKVPLEAQGPIGRGLSALLIRRSSATLQGIFYTQVL